MCISNIMTMAYIINEAGAVDQKEGYLVEGKKGVY